MLGHSGRRLRLLLRHSWRGRIGRLVINAKFFVSDGIAEVLDVLGTPCANLDFFPHDCLFGDVDLLFGQGNTNRRIGDRLTVDVALAADGVTLDDELFVTHGDIDRLHLRDDLFAYTRLAMLHALLIEHETLRTQLNLTIFVDVFVRCRGIDLGLRRGRTCDGPRCSGGVANVGPMLRKNCDSTIQVRARIGRDERGALDQTINDVVRIAL